MSHQVSQLQAQAVPPGRGMGGVLDSTESPGGMSGSRYLTLDQVAELLQVSNKSVYRWAQQDASFPACRLGRAVRVREDLLARWLAARTQRSRRS
jgi:excisionase family DNA binding protein